MNTIARILLLIALFGLLAFCLFGFLASGELEGERMLKWRIGYSLGGMAVLTGIVLTAKGHGNPAD
jgi:hypothetical protein